MRLPLGGVLQFGDPVACAFKSGKFTMVYIFTLGAIIFLSFYFLLHLFVIMHFCFFNWGFAELPESIIFKNGE